MAYAALEESVRILEGLDLPASALRLSRRIRHLPVAVDREDDVAATMFLRRGVSGEPWIDVHSLARGEGGWRLLGGGSGTADQSLLADGREAADAAVFARSLGGGGTVLNADRLMPWGAKWVRWAELRMAAGVATLQVGDRSIPVAPHGVALIVWGSRRPPRAVALGADGQELGQLRLRGG